MTTVNILVVTDPQESFVMDLITYMASQMPSLMNQGFAGYNVLTKDMASPIPVPDAPDRVAGFMGNCILQGDDNEEAVAKALNPINETIQQRWPNKVQVYTTLKQYDSFLGWFDEHYDTNQAGERYYIVSRLLDGEALTGNDEALKNAFEVAMSTGVANSMEAFMVAGKGVQEAVPREIAR